jgi:hypothetical protein
VAGRLGAHGGPSPATSMARPDISQAPPGPASGQVTRQMATHVTAPAGLRHHPFRRRYGEPVATSVVISCLVVVLQQAGAGTQALLGDGTRRIVTLVIAVIRRVRCGASDDDLIGAAVPPLAVYRHWRRENDPQPGTVEETSARVDEKDERGPHLRTQHPAARLRTGSKRRFLEPPTEAPETSRRQATPSSFRTIRAP